MKVTITSILEINKLQYLNYKADQFNLWCKIIAHEFYLPRRILQENKPLYAWYATNWDNRITEIFLKENAEYIEAGVKDEDSYQGLFQIAVVKPLHDIYPSAIIDKLKKIHYEKLRNTSKNISTK